MNRLPLVYIAGPYSKGDCVVNSRAAMEVWDQLWNTNLVAPFCPHWSMFQHFVRPVSYEGWLEYDFQIIARCDAMLRLSGESAGADREVEFALSRNQPVFYSEGELLDWAREWQS